MTWTKSQRHPAMPSTTKHRISMRYERKLCHYFLMYFVSAFVLCVILQRKLFYSNQGLQSSSQSFARFLDELQISVGAANFNFSSSIGKLFVHFLSRKRPETKPRWDLYYKHLLICNCTNKY